MSLPDDIDLQGVMAIRAFVHRTVRVNCSTFRRTFKVNCEQAHIDTGDSTIKETSLPRALAALEPTDEARAVNLAIFTGRDNGAVALVWRRAGRSYAEVAGRRRTWVLGVSRALDRFVRQHGYERPQPTSARWRLRGLTRGVAIEALGMLAGTGLLALLGILLTAVLR